MNAEQLTDRLLEVFRKYGRPLKLNEISRELGISSNTEEYDFLKEVLNFMTEQNLITKSARRRYSLQTFEDSSSLKGKLTVQHGKGIVETNDNEYPRVTVKRRFLANALDGDVVLVKLLALRKGKKPRGEVIQVLERNQNSIVGTIDFDGNFYYLIPDEEKHYLDYLIPKKNLNHAEHGDKVSAQFLMWEDPTKNPQAKIEKILGKAGAAKVEYDSIIEEFDLPVKFPDHVLEEANSFSKPRNQASYKNRIDLRDKLIVTIDPEDAKDFDDALSLDFAENGDYILGVHIADVSHYVTENSVTDIEARMRGTSVYLVDRVIPMLPEALSNEVCSLKPNEVRYAFTCFMTIDHKGNVKDYKIHESAIKSKRRYTYDEVLQVLNGENNDKYEELLKDLHKVATLLREKRFSKGGIDFNTKEVKFKLDEDKNPVGIVLKQSNIATQLVEECMLIANQTVAGHVKEVTTNLGLEKLAPYVYRVHEAPSEKNIKDVLSFINTLGPKFKSKDISSREINKILEKFKGTPEASIVNQVFIRSMPKAIYSHKNVGHYGLGFQDYTHFTSPIRRYPDLIVHRLLKEYMKKRIPKDRQKYLSYLLKDVAAHSTDRERAAMEAERASIKLTHAIHTKKHLGEEFEGTVTGVTTFGIFVEMDNIYAEGLLHIKDMHDDYYMYDEKNYRLIGKKYNRSYRIGKRIKVKIVKVNVDKRQIDLDFVEDL